MSDNTTPNIPSIPSTVDSTVRRAFDEMRRWFANVRKQGGTVTQQDMIDAGVLDVNGSPFVDTSVPPRLGNVVAAGAFRTITLTWDNPRYRRFGYVEVWRATANDLGVAVRIGTTEANIYTDSPPQASLAVTYYYWVRIISTANNPGPFSDVASGSTASDPLYMIQVLSEELAKVVPTVSVPDLVYAVNRFALKMGTGDGAVYPFIVAEVPGAPGTYAVFMNTAFIKDGTITNAKIGNLAVDTANIAAAAITEEKVGDGEIGNAKIGNIIESNGYTPGVTGWIINKDGTAEFRNIVARGNIEATTIKADSVNIISTLMLQGQTVVYPLHGISWYSSSLLDTNFADVSEREQSFLSLTHPSATGAPISIVAQIKISGAAGLITGSTYLKVYMARTYGGVTTNIMLIEEGHNDSDTPAQIDYAGPVIFKDTPPGAGSVTYSFRVMWNNGQYQIYVEKQSILLLETKR